MSYRTLIAGMLALVCSATATARAPLELKPSTKWDIDYGKERCSLMRDFGSSDRSLHLQIDSFGEWNVFRVLLIGTALPGASGPTGTASILRTGDPEPIKVDTLQGKSGEVPSLSFDFGFTPPLAPGALKHMSEEERQRWKREAVRPHPDYDATIKTIEINSRGTAVMLDTGSLGEPLAAMRACVDDMYKSWGMDPEQQRALSKHAEPTSATVSRVKGDYPAAQLFSGTNAYVPVRLAVDAGGTATSCVVQAQGIDKAFTAAVCDHLQHSFKPALDAAGKPVPSMFHTAVVYLVSGRH